MQTPRGSAGVSSIMRKTMGTQSAKKRRVMFASHVESDTEERKHDDDESSSAMEVEVSSPPPPSFPDRPSRSSCTIILLLPISRSKRKFWCITFLVTSNQFIMVWRHVKRLTNFKIVSIATARRRFSRHVRQSLLKAAKTRSLLRNQVQEVRYQEVSATRYYPYLSHPKRQKPFHAKTGHLQSLLLNTLTLTIRSEYKA